MIDYLEAILDEETEESLFRQKRRRGLVFGRKKRAEEEMPLAADAASARSVALAGTTVPAQGELDQKAAGTDDRMAVPQGLGMEAQQKLSSAPLDGTARQASSMTPSQLYEALGHATRLSRTALHSGTPLPTVLTVESTTGEKNQDWEALDRAVQRDARRYDGGFSLY